MSGPDWAELDDLLDRIDDHLDAGGGGLVPDLSRHLFGISESRRLDTARRKRIDRTLAAISARARR